MPSGCAAPDIDGLDEGHGLGVEHGNRDGAGEAVAGFRIDGSAVASDAGDLADRFKGVEIEYSEAARDGRHFWS